MNWAYIVADIHNISVADQTFFYVKLGALAEDKLHFRLDLTKLKSTTQLVPETLWPET